MIDIASNKAVSMQQVSESLRGPLASLGVCLQTLRDHAGGEAAPFVTSALGDVERLARLANHLLQWNELQEGTLSAHASAFRVSACMTDVLEWHMQEARLKEVPFRVALAPGDDRAWTDPDHAAGVLDALLEHVVTTTTEGGVDVSVRVEEERCTVTVTADHAAGSTDSLHLARARALADLIGGQVHVQSTVSAGVAFMAHWPLRLPRETSLYLAA